MAKIIKPPYFESVVNAGEKRLLDFLEVNLPENYYLIPNVEIASTNPRNNLTQYWEYDIIVVAPHAIYNIENKDWKGRIEGDDNYWYLNDRQKPNPLKTGRQKTAILASKLKENEPSWGKAWIQNMVTLSFPNTYAPSLWKEAGKLTFELKETLINYISDPGQVGKYENAISDVQKVIVEFLIGSQSKKSPNEKREVEGYEITEILQQEPNFTEYLVKPKGIESANKKRIKEYALQVKDLSTDELHKRELKIQNGFKALDKIKSNPFITNVQYRLDEDNHLFYEITDFMEEDSLRSCARSKTFTFQEKISIIKNIMAALKAAHEQNVLHRDINPENIYFRGGYAILGNFGKAYFTDHNEQGYTVQATINESNATAYHPLELTVGDASRASDLYSLGVLMYWLFVGEEPFKTPYDLDKMGGKLSTELLPCKVNASLPKWLDELCNKTILVDDLQRMDSIDELEEYLEDALNVDESTTSSAKEHQKKPIKVVEKAELKEGDRIGDYIVYEVLGQGGYSKVFKVKHSLQGKEYALKLFHGSVNISSVLDEYNTLKELNHPNIIKFIWNGTSPSGQFYTLTEYLEGENLSMYARTDARLPLIRVYQIAQEILSALILMQSQTKPILHRDVKPHNIIWVSHERFVLIDFNVASFAEDNQDFVGTNPYLAPDLIGENYKVNWNKSADVFSLGVTLYELICKQYPWHPHGFPSVSISPVNPKEVEPRLSDEFSNFILKAISTDAKERFSSAAEMLLALENIGENNILKENIIDLTGIDNTDHLYHTEISIYQEGVHIKLFNKMNNYVNLNESIEDALARFRENLRNFKISFDKNIRLQLKVDSEIIISEDFWFGGAKTFTQGNMDRVYKSLKDTFARNKEKIKSFKIDIEGLDIVEYINSIFSQSKSGNFGTRANYSISEFDNLTYSPSKLDRKLIPDILDGRYKLLIITGNAGDGKTAFIRKIEEDKSISDLNRFPHKNGATFQINGMLYESNYDGSQDEDERANNEVLENFFNPFESLKNYNDANEGRIIAINEGRLVEFLSTSKKHGHLAKTIEEYFYHEGHHKLPDGLMIINLNLRSVTARDNAEPSLFRQQVKALTRKDLWTKCDSCKLVNFCFVKYNVDTFNDPAAGEEVITRMEWLLRTASLKRELHITMRDLRSFISYTLTRDYDCEEIDNLYNTDQNNPEKYWQNYYFNITNPGIDDLGNQDRLIKLLRETDIGEVAIPDADRNLFFENHQSKNYLEFADRKINLLETFNKNKLWIPAHEQTPELTNRIKVIQKNFVRHQYFEGKAELLDILDDISQNGNVKKHPLKMPTYLLRLPYHSVFKFERVLSKGDAEFLTIESISRAISLNEGCDNQNIDKDYLVLSSTEVKDPFSKSFRLFNLKDFELFVNRTDHLVNYLEYEADSLIFRHKVETHIKLTISLDLFEMLYFIQQGFSPSLNDLRGKFIELIIFKNLLKNLNYNEVVVTNDDIEYYRISKDSSNHLHINAMEL